MKALITGVAGFVGSHLAEYLVKHTDWDVVGTLRHHEPVDNLEGLAHYINNEHRMRVVDLDIEDAWRTRQVFTEEAPNYVFHLAAQSYPPASFGAPAAAIRANTIGTVNVLEACRAIDAWIQVCSSSEVYGRTKETLIAETAAFHPASPYSISKIGADLLAQHYAEAYGLNVVITRMFTHTGPRRGDVFAESSFAKQIAMIEVGQLEPPIMVGNLDSLRTVADVRDAVRAYHMALTINPVAGEVYNIGGNHTCTIREILDALFAAAGQQYEVAVDPARLRPVDADCQVPDWTKFAEHTGWKPGIPFKQTMDDLLEYWRDRVRRGTPLQR